MPIKAKKRKSLRKDEIAASVNKSLWEMAKMGVVAIVKYISESLGSERLVQTFQEVFAGEQPPSLATIHLAIRLDHYDGFPEKEALELIKEVIDNPFAFAVVRDLIWMRFYLYHTDYRLRQKFGEKLKISSTGKKKLVGRPQRKPPPEPRRIR